MVDTSNIIFGPQRKQDVANMYGQIAAFCIDWVLVKERPSEERNHDLNMLKKTYKKQLWTLTATYQPNWKLDSWI